MIPRKANKKENCWYRGCEKIGYPNAYWGEKSVYFCGSHINCNTSKVDKG